MALALTSIKAISKNPSGVCKRDVETRTLEAKQELFEQEVELTLVTDNAAGNADLIVPIPTNLDNVLSLELKSVTESGNVSSSVVVKTPSIAVGPGTVTNVPAAGSGTTAVKNSLVSSTTLYNFDGRYVTPNGTEKETELITRLNNASYVDPNRYINPTFTVTSATAIKTYVAKVRMTGYKFA